MSVIIFIIIFCYRLLEKEIIEGNGKTAHQIWTTLEKSFTMSPEKWKLEIKNKINYMKFNEEDDINIFIAKL